MQRNIALRLERMRSLGETRPSCKCQPDCNRPGRAVWCLKREVLRRHRELKTRLSAYILGVQPLVILTAPVIYRLLIPIALLDLWVTVYQPICFRWPGFPTASSGPPTFDRHHLAYLNGIEKLNCVYCGYANGVIGYVRRWRAAPSRTGVRSGTPGAWPARTHTMGRLKTTATRRATSGGSRSCVRRWRTKGMIQFIRPAPPAPAIHVALHGVIERGPGLA